MKVNFHRHQTEVSDIFLVGAFRIDSQPFDQLVPEAHAIAVGGQLYR
jgi:hypothetical protein